MMMEAKTGECVLKLKEGSMNRGIQKVLEARRGKHTEGMQPF